VPSRELAPDRTHRVRLRERFCSAPSTLTYVAEEGAPGDDLFRDVREVDGHYKTAWVNDSMCSIGKRVRAMHQLSALTWFRLIPTCSEP